jgi:hypothetical protein
MIDFVAHLVDPSNHCTLLLKDIAEREETLFLKMTLVSDKTKFLSVGGKEDHVSPTPLAMSSADRSA